MDAREVVSEASAIPMTPRENADVRKRDREL